MTERDFWKGFGVPRNAEVLFDVRDQRYVVWKDEGRGRGDIDEEETARLQEKIAPFLAALSTTPPPKEEKAKEKNREDTLRLTYKLLRRLETQVNQAGFAGCPECGAPDKGSERLPEIQHQPGCLMAAALERWESHFSEAERGLRVAVAALGYEGEKVLVGEEGFDPDKMLEEMIRGKRRLIGDHHQHLQRPKEAQNPSQPPGATIPPNQGVGMGEGEKVAQDGAEEAEEGALPLCDFQNLVARSDNLEGRVSGLFGRIKALEQNVEALRSRVVRNEELEDAPRPSCDCPHEMRSDCATCNPHPSTTFAVCDLHHYCGPWPCPSCPPAPPPCAEPAEETSSDGERCGEGTAGGAGHTCSRKGVEVYLTPALIQYEGWSFCPRCGEKLEGEA